MDITISLQLTTIINAFKFTMLFSDQQKNMILHQKVKQTLITYWHVVIGRVLQ